MTIRSESINEDKLYPRLVLDFANTLSSRGSSQPGDLLKHYNDLITWSVQSGQIDVDKAQALMDYAYQVPEKGEQTLQRAILLREAIYHLIEAAKEKVTPQQGDLDTLNNELALAARHNKLAFHLDHFAWEWECTAKNLEQVVWPIAQAAANLLDSTYLKRIGICEDDTCRWLFYDSSKNHSRRWCDMDDCGNRAKARRHYARKKESGDLDLD
jgi:predicted RNA-binding Zn ribbon-like protein